MQISTNLLGIVNANYPLQGIVDIKNAKFPSVFLDGDVIGKSQDLEQLKNIAFIGSKEGLSTQIVRIPSIEEDSFYDENINDKIVSLSVEYMKVCMEIGCEYIIVPPLCGYDTREEAWNINHDFYLKLMKKAKEMADSGPALRVLLQNIGRDMNGHIIRGFFSDSKEICRWIDDLNREVKENYFGLCVDVGTLNLCGIDLYGYIEETGKRIQAVLVRENDGQTDCSLLPFTSAICGKSSLDWLGMIRGLRNVGFDGHLIMDFSDSAKAFSPILRPKFLDLAYSVAEYFKWQLEIEKLLKKYKNIVLFGAGNMCKNFMVCYGEQYVPLFTCDNNKNMWGKKVYGLEVKSPESLSELSKDTAIFICNTYYREIEIQLRNMGIENPIEYFNDEYLSSFYLK